MPVTSGLGRSKGKRIDRTSRGGLRVNRRIRVPQVRVIGEDGDQLGLMATQEAFHMAQESGLDLVEVSPLAKPPVCKLMDYGKFKYEQKRKASLARKNQQQISLKEVKFRPKTDNHDFYVKVSNLKRFLTEGHKTKVTVVLRGREIVHKDIGEQLLVRVREALADMAMLETNPHLEGRQIFMILAPGKTSVKKKEKLAQEENQAPQVALQQVRTKEEDEG
ncbi:MAG: translation initiation factor IF-3 [Myxococcota bacterium]